MAWEHARKFQFGMKTKISQFQLMSIHLNPSSYLQTLRFHRCCVSFFLAYLWPAGPARPSREARFRLEGRWFMTRHPMTSDINTQIAMLKKSLSCHIMLLKLYHANANGFPRLRAQSWISRSWRLGNAVECQLDQWQGTETPKRLVHNVMSCGFIGLRNVAMLQEVSTKYHQKKRSKQ